MYKRQFQRNAERYEFLKWGQQAFQTFSVVPPSVGIVHQVNLESVSYTHLDVYKRQLVPVLPLYLTGQLQVSSGWLGWIMAIYVLAAIISRPWFRCV